jgi:hypothetical protein
VTLPTFTPQRRTTDSSRSRRARCSAAERAAGTELRRAAARAQTVLAEDAAATASARVPLAVSDGRAATTAGNREPESAAPRAAARDRAVTTAAASKRSARVADAVVAQWLLEQVPRHGGRRMRAAA